MPRPGIPRNTQILSARVTFNELTHLDQSPTLRPILGAMDAHLVGGDHERARSEGIGTVHVFVDDDGHLHLDFVSDTLLDEKLLTSPRDLRLTIDGEAPSIARPTEEDIRTYGCETSAEIPSRPKGSPV